MMTEKRVIGHVKCFDCGGTVEVRLDKSSRAYYACDGRADRRLCNASFKWSMPTSRKMKDAAAAVEEGGKDAGVSADQNTGDKRKRVEQHEAGGAGKSSGGGKISIYGVEF